MYTKIKNTEMEFERGIQLVNILLGWPRKDVFVFNVNKMWMRAFPVE